MNLRADNTFVQDDGWYRAAGWYDDFVRRHQNMPVLYLELGVGMNTPGIIKFNFWHRSLATHRRAMPASTAARHPARKKSNTKACASTPILARCWNNFKRAAAMYPKGQEPLGYKSFCR